MSLSKAENWKLRTKLMHFCGEFIRYKEFALAKQRRVNLTSNQEAEFQKLSVELQRLYGGLKEVIEKYGGRAVVRLGGVEYEAFSSAFSPEPFHPDALTAVMDTAIATVNMAIGRLQSPTLVESVAPIETLAPPKAFIAHGGETPALNKLREFLNALGVIPIIAEEQPSEGRSINEQVKWCLDRCDCAIVLATKGDIDGVTGEFIPRGNVLNEIGRFQEKFSSRIVYLIESGTKFPTNISEKVRERFKPQSMDKAFIKVAKELTAFGLIKAVKPE